MNKLKIRYVLPVLCASAFLAAGCGGETTDVSAGTADFNKELAAEGAKLDCPKEVDGGEGTEFECTLNGKSGKSAKVKLKVVKQDGDLAVDIADQKGFDTARQQVSGE